MRWVSAVAAACLLSACAYTSRDMAREIEANRSAGRPLFIYSLGVENNAGYLNNNTAAGIGLINTGSQAITGLKITFIPYETLHSPALAGTPRTIDLSGLLPQGGVPSQMGALPTWDDGSSLMDCFHMERMDITFADGTHAAVTGKALDASMASNINRGCASGVKSPDYKAINLPPVTPSMSGGHH